MATSPATLIRASALSLLAAAPALFAQEGGGIVVKKNYGFQIGVMLPQGDLADLQVTGYGAAGFYETVFSNCLAARGRLEYTVFGKNEQSLPGWPTFVYTEQLKQVGVMLDLIYYHKFKDTVYPFAGVGFFQRTVDTSYSANFGGTGTSGADLKSEMAVCAGMGVNFTRNLGMEAKYTLCEYNWAQVSLLYRF